MKIIREYISPNFEKRKSFVVPDMVIIHYTGMETTESALERLCSAHSKVSSHYLINRNGKIWQLVEEDMASWHAGESSWLNKTNLNQSSIGIELCNPGHDFEYKKFTEKQMFSLEWLLRTIKNKYSIRIESILGHSDVAPLRKKDPGEKFDWKRLAQQGLAVWTDNTEELPEIYNQKDLIYESLKNIGYDVDNYYNESIVAFKRHFIPENVSHLVLEEELKIFLSVSKYFNKIRTIS